jgi:hypothetical protein
MASDDLFEGLPPPAAAAAPAAGGERAPSPSPPPPPRLPALKSALKRDKLSSSDAAASSPAAAAATDAAAEGRGELSSRALVLRAKLDRCLLLLPLRPLLCVVGFGNSDALLFVRVRLACVLCCTFCQRLVADFSSPRS